MKILRHLWLGGLLLLALIGPYRDAAAEPGSVGLLPPHGIPSLAGERCAYTLDFLVFRDLAEGELQLTAEPTPGRYRAELVARTLGVASWLTGERTQRYQAVMEEDGSGRLRTVSYVSSMLRRDDGGWHDRQKRYRFDYAAGKIYQERGRDGHFTPGLVFELPADEALPVDILTGFYNLRAGAYGALVPGARLQIPTFTSRGIATLAVEVLAGQERLARPFFPAGGTLLRVWADPEIFDTGGAAIYVWFDASGRPARGIVENVIGLGDVYGRLRTEESRQP
jgi:hypothetical protein